MNETPEVTGDPSPDPIAFSAALKALVLAGEEIRDEEWNRKLSALLYVAPLRFDPQDPAITGPDGIEYVKTKWPAPIGPNNVITVRGSLKDFVKTHAGLAIFGDTPRPELVVSPGDILSYHLYGDRDFVFEGGWGEPADPNNYNDVETLSVGEPSEQLFPVEVAHAVHHILQAIFAQQPKTLKRKPKVGVIRPGHYGEVEDLPSDLVFNIYAEDFQDPDVWQWAKSVLVKHLPRCLRLRVLFPERATLPESRFALIESRLTEQDSSGETD